MMGLSKFRCDACPGKYFSYMEGVDHVICCHLRDEPVPGGESITGDWAMQWECANCRAKFFLEQRAQAHKDEKGEEHKYRKIDARRYSDAQKRAGMMLLEDRIHELLRCHHEKPYEAKITDAVKSQFVHVTNIVRADDRYPPEARMAMKGAPPTRRGKSNARSTSRAATGSPGRTPDSGRTPEPSGPRPKGRPRTKSPAANTPQKPPGPRAKTPTKAMSPADDSPARRTRSRSRSKGPDYSYNPAMAANPRRPAMYGQTRSRSGTPADGQRSRSTTPSNGAYDTRAFKKMMAEDDKRKQVEEDEMLAMAIAGNLASQKMALKRAGGAMEEPAKKKPSLLTSKASSPPPTKRGRQKTPAKPETEKKKGPTPGRRGKSKTPVKEPTPPPPTERRPGPIGTPHDMNLKKRWQTIFVANGGNLAGNQPAKQEVVVEEEEAGAPIQPLTRRIAHQPRSSVENDRAVEPTAGPFMARRRTPALDQRDPSSGREQPSPVEQESTRPPAQDRRPATVEAAFAPSRQKTVPVRPTAPPPAAPRQNGHAVPGPSAPAPEKAVKKLLLPPKAPPAPTTTSNGQQGIPSPGVHREEAGRQSNGQPLLSRPSDSNGPSPFSRPPAPQPGRPLPVPPPLPIPDFHPHAARYRRQEVNHQQQGPIGGQVGQAGQVYHNGALYDYSGQGGGPGMLTSAMAIVLPQLSSLPGLVPPPPPLLQPAQGDRARLLPSFSSVRPQNYYSATPPSR